MKSLRTLLEDGSTTLVPGVGDALGAILAKEAGFECINMSGYFASALLGHLDVGLVTGSEMVEQAARICAAVDKVPVLSDADTGYGNVINVIRTVRDFEQVGVSGIHLEDQTLPKKSGALDELPLISAAEMCGKIEAAVDARRSRDFCIVARSDAAGSHGIEEAIRRAGEYRRAGADAYMIMGARSLDDMKRYRDAIDGPLVCTVGSWGFKVTYDDLKRLGYSLAFFTVSILRRQIAVTRELLAELRDTGAIDHNSPRLVTMKEMHECLGLEKITAWEKKYSGSPS